MPFYRSLPFLHSATWALLGEARKGRPPAHPSLPCLAESLGRSGVVGPGRPAAPDPSPSGGGGGGGAQSGETSLSSGGEAGESDSSSSERGKRAAWPVQLQPPCALLGAPLPSFLCFTRRFWNQIFTCFSDRLR
ncbi:UNVERIFIED_CONTAM: hypothetical protein K2H54_056100 [Gekko kuhli]